VSECVSLVDAEVKSKSGFSGIAVKSAYGVVTAVKPRFVGEVVDGMLDEWVQKLQPFYDKWKTDGGGRPFADYLSSNKTQAAESLLEVTDGRAKTSKHGTVRKMYEKMRPSAKKHVEEALPRLGALVERNAGK
jgi:hypothetical protein